MIITPGTEIERYHVVESLGQGGMAEVYKAFDTRLERDVAIKVIRRNAFSLDTLERVLKRFDREAKSLAKLTHPNIVSIIDYGEYEGAPYLVMPYLPGGTLKARLGSPIPYADAAAILQPIADGLAYAHQKGIVHRDVKPGNILITEGGQPMLTDFGIARLLENDEAATLTGTGVGIGTPEYMAPEQGLGREVDGRADIYSLGVVFYELVTGQKPYTADTPMAVVLKQSTEPLPKPSSLIAGLPEKVEQVMYKALAKKPEDRYQTMTEFEKALSRLCLGNDFQSVPPVQSVRVADLTEMATSLEATSAQPGQEPIIAAPPLPRPVLHSEPSSIPAARSAVDAEATEMATSLEVNTAESRQVVVTVTPPPTNTVSHLAPPILPDEEPKKRVGIWLALGVIALVCFIVLIVKSLSKPHVYVEATEAPTVDTSYAVSSGNLLADQRNWTGDQLHVYQDYFEDPAPTPGYITFEYESIYVSRPGQQDYRVSELGGCGSPVWSPDGNWIAFIRTSLDWSSSYLVIVDAEGNLAKEIHGDFQLDRIEDLSWSPDGKSLVACDYQNARMVKIDVESESVSTLVPTTVESISISPDGNFVAYMTREGDTNDDDAWLLNIYNFNTSSITKITTVDDRFGLIGPFNWTSDGQFVIFQGFNLDEQGERFNYATYQVRPDGSDLQVLSGSIEVIDQSYYPWFITING